MIPRVKVIPISGMLDSVNGVQLRRMVDEALKAGSRTILLDCTAVEFMDSSGLGALVMALKQTRLMNGQLLLCGINDQLKMLLELTDMNGVFEVFADRQACEQSLSL